MVASRVLSFLTYSLVARGTLAGDWVDPDTADEFLSTTSFVDGSSKELVFSDEFDVAGRTFNDGHDPRWTAINKDDYTNAALHYYDESHVRTTSSPDGAGGVNGYLNISTTASLTTFTATNDKTHLPMTKTKYFKSGMIQGWNKFCFTGGVVEIKARLPGPAYIGGYWPAIWLMGNLARATYVGSSDWVWPWSYDACDRSIQKQQVISACNPYPHYNMHNKQGRGAPEIDILEAMPGNAPMYPSNIRKPYFSASLQVSPGITTADRPYKGGFPKPGAWYEGMEYGNNTSQNVFFYGSRTEKPNPDYSYQADALSGNTQMNDNLWSDFRVFRVEWKLPTPASGAPVSSPHEQHNAEEGKGGGYIRWYMDGDLVYGVTGKVLASKMGANIPSEPSYVIMNNAMSSTWGFPEGEGGCPKDCTCSCYNCLDLSGKCSCGFAPGFCAEMPGYFLIDYVRVWQDASNPLEKVGCSTPERPTATWIKGHLKDYMSVTDKVPLQPQAVGGGPCSLSGPSDDSEPDCGRELGFGKCVPSPPSVWAFLGPVISDWFGLSSSSPASSSSGGGSDGVCSCHKGRVGPWCLAAEAEDPIKWMEDTEGGGRSLGFVAPVLPSELVGIAVALAVAFGITFAAQVFKMRGTNRTFFQSGVNDADLGPPVLKKNQSSEGMVADKGYTLSSRPSETLLNRMTGLQ